MMTMMMRDEERETERKKERKREIDEITYTSLPFLPPPILSPATV